MFKRFTSLFIGIMLLVGTNVQAINFEWVKHAIALGIAAPVVYNAFTNDGQEPSPYYYGLASMVVSYYFSDFALQRGQKNTEIALKSAEFAQFTIQRQQSETMMRLGNIEKSLEREGVFVVKRPKSPKENLLIENVEKEKFEEKERKK